MAVGPLRHPNISVMHGLLFTIVGPIARKTRVSRSLDTLSQNVWSTPLRLTVFKILCVARNKF